MAVVNSINVKDYGAKGDGLSDDTAAIAAANDASIQADRTVVPVYFPEGQYRCHEAPWNGKVPWIGAESGGTYLIYNGVGATGSSVVIGNVDTASGPYLYTNAGFYNITIQGFDGSNGRIAESCLRVVGDMTDEWYLDLSVVGFQQCYGDAILLAAGVVNISWDTIAFDSVGGYGITVRGINYASGTKTATIKNYTYANNINAAFASKAYTDNYYNVSSWGKGFFHADSCQNMRFNFSDGKAYMSKPLTAVDNEIALFYTTNTISDTAILYVGVTNLRGEFPVSAPGIVVRNGIGTCYLAATNAAVSGMSTFSENTTADVSGGNTGTVGGTADSLVTGNVVIGEFETGRHGISAKDNLSNQIFTLDESGFSFTGQINSGSTLKQYDGTSLPTDSLSSNIIYKVEIVSSNGLIFTKGGVNTTLTARIYRGSEDVTDQLNASQFKWTRISDDPVGDTAWNNYHASGVKSIDITPTDVLVKATFMCQLYSPQ